MLFGICFSYYSYDAIGNLIADTQEEIKNIEWTVSGKVKRVTRLKLPGSKKPDLEFEYDASGQRIVKKVIKTDGTTASTYYLRDASGNVMSVYEIIDSDNAPVLAEQYIYGSSRVGVYTPVAAGSIENMGSRSFGRKSYELSDHLGNVRATLSDYKTQAKPQIVNSATDYYPFGMAMVERQVVNLQNSNMYRYGFNGKEHEDDITGGDYDFGARIYDSRIARWLAVDPLYAKYPDLSPYCFVANSPLIAIDPDGEKIVYVGTTAEKKQMESALKLMSKNSVYARKMIRQLDNSKNVHSIVFKPNGYQFSDDALEARKNDSPEKYNKNLKDGKEWKDNINNSDISETEKEVALEIGSVTINDTQSKAWQSGVYDNEAYNGTGTGSTMYLSYADIADYGALAHELKHMKMADKGKVDGFSIFEGTLERFMRINNEMPASTASTIVSNQLNKKGIDATANAYEFSRQEKRQYKDAIKGIKSRGGTKKDPTKKTSEN